jgi:hypothetical protein
MYSKKKTPWQPVHDRHYSISTHPDYIVPVLYTLGVEIQYMSGTSLGEATFITLIDTRRLRLRLYALLGLFTLNKRWRVHFFLEGG